MRRIKIGCGLLAVAAPLLYLMIQFLVAQGFVMAAAVYFAMGPGAGDISEVTGQLYRFLDVYGMALVIVSQIAGLAVFGSWFYGAVVRKSKRVGMGSMTDFRAIAGTGLLALGTYLGVFLYLSLLEWILPDIMAVYNGYMEEAGIADLSLISTAATVIMAPLVEEIIFRGLSFQYLERAGAGFWPANIIQAALFAFVHLQLIQGSYAFVLGLILGCLMRRYRTLAAPVLFHCFFNLFGTYLAVWMEGMEVTSRQLLPISLGMTAAVLAGLKVMGSKDQKKFAP